MIENYVKQIFYNRKAGISGNFFKAAVLMPLIDKDGEPQVLFQVRAKHLAVQPGEICFPGGGVEKGESYREAAIRETIEEFCIDRDNIKIFGELDLIVSPFDLIVYPFIGKLRGITSARDISFDTNEVSDVFSVPVRFFIDTKPELHYVSINAQPEESFPYHLVPDGKNYKWREGRYPVYFYLYQEYVIWGITARIINNFVDLYKKGGK